MSFSNMKSVKFLVQTFQLGFIFMSINPEYILFSIVYNIKCMTIQFITPHPDETRFHQRNMQAAQDKTKNMRKQVNRILVQIS